MHTARSRNDIDMTMYRMRQRELILALTAAPATAAAHCSSSPTAPQTVFAAHTHTQPAQPTTIAHYLLAVIEQLERDTRRGCTRRYDHEPIASARRLRDHRHRISDRS